MRLPLPSSLRDEPSLVALMILVALIMGGNSLVLPMLPVYGATFGLGGTMIGLLVTVFAVGRLVVNIPAAMLSNRFGPRKVLYAGAGVIALGSAVGALAQTYEALLVARVIQGIGSGMYMTISAVMVLEYAKPSERGRVTAIYQGSLLAGISIGPAIGGFAAANFGFSAPFWLYTVVALAAIVLGPLLFRGPPPPVTEAPKKGAPTSMGGLLRRPSFLIICLIYFALFFARGGTQNQTVPLVAHQEFHISIEFIGIAFGLGAAMNVVMFPVIGRSIDRFGSRTINIVSSIVTGLAMIVMALAHDPRVFWAGYYISALSNGFNGPAAAAAVGEEAPRPLLATAVSLQRMAADIGLITAPLVIGAIYDFTPTGHAGGFLFTAALTISLGIALAIVSRRRKPAEE